MGLEKKTLSILITDDAEIRQINKRFLGRDSPTNVISFSYYKGSENFSDLLGDIVISLERAHEEAKNSGTSTYERLIALLIHGIVHILGYDHERDEKEKRRMSYMEKKLLRYVKSLPEYETLLDLEREIPK